MIEKEKGERTHTKTVLIDEIGIVDGNRQTPDNQSTTDKLCRTINHFQVKKSDTLMQF